MEVWKNHLHGIFPLFKSTCINTCHTRMWRLATTCSLRDQHYDHSKVQMYFSVKRYRIRDEVDCTPFTQQNNGACWDLSIRNRTNTTECSSMKFLRRCCGLGVGRGTVKRRSYNSSGIFLHCEGIPCPGKGKYATTVENKDTYWLQN